ILHFRRKGIQKTATSKLGRLLVRYAFRGSEVVCLSHHHSLDVQGWVSLPPYFVPNGIKVETEYLQEAEQTIVKSDDDPVKILFVSNLSRKKGVPELIEALSNVKQKGRQFTASLIGGEWDLSFEDVKRLIDSHGLS